MKKLRALTLRVAGVFSKDRREQEFAAEIESHVQMEVEDNLRAGMSAEEARRAALCGTVAPAVAGAVGLGACIDLECVTELPIASDALGDRQ